MESEYRATSPILADLFDDVTTSVLKALVSNDIARHSLVANQPNSCLEFLTSHTVDLAMVAPDEENDGELWLWEGCFLESFQL